MPPVKFPQKINAFLEGNLAKIWFICLLPDWKNLLKIPPHLKIIVWKERLIPSISNPWSTVSSKPAKTNRIMPFQIIAKSYAFAKRPGRCF